MDTDRDWQPGSGLREVNALMRLLTNLNAGAMLALCLWLAWTALDYNARQSGSAGVIKVQGCGCTLSEVTNWSGRFDVAARD
jgi:hypothetical protein